MSRDLILDVMAKKNSRDLSTLADEFDRLAKQTDDAGASMHKTTTFSKYLDDQLAKTKVQVRELGQEFERTGDKDVFAKLRGSQSNLKSLERIKKDLAGALEAGVKDAVPAVEQAGSEAGQGFWKGMWSTFQGLPPEAQVAIAGGVGAALAVSLPFVGSAIAGTLLAAVGAVGIGAAIAGQIRDPTVAAALSELKDRLLSSLTWATSAFEPVLKRTALMLADTFDAMAPEMRRAFDQLAPYAQRFFDGFGGFISEIMPGFNHALVVGGQILARLGDDLPGLGRTFSEFFDMIAGGAVGASDAFHDLIVIIEGTVLAVGAALRAFSDGFAIIELMADAATGNWVDFAAKVARFAQGDGPAAHNALGSIGSDMTIVSANTDDATTAVKNFSDALDVLFHKNMSADEAILKVNESISNLSDSIQQNGRHWDENTQAGQRNRQALYDVLTNLEAKRQADIAAGKNAALAAVDFNKQADAAFAIAGKAGLAKQELDRLKGRYEIDIDTIHRQIYSTMTAAQFAANPHGLASGGRVPGYAYGGGVIKVGEMGPEYLSLPPTQGPAYVTPNSAINGAANGGGGGQVQMLRVVLEWPDGRVIQERLVDFGRSRGYQTVEQVIPIGTAR